jgi:hypothetical protein
MTQEALKLALDALENHTAIKHPQQIHYRDKAITAIKEALAQPEQFCNTNCVWTDHHPDCRLTQTQEPVAWVAEDVCEGQYIDGRPRKIWWECEKGVGTAFYTHLPQRTWVGLTIEEIAACCMESTTTQLSFYNAIEAKLKEKNHVAQEADKTTGARR